MELQNSKGGLELGLGSAVTLHRMATLDESNLSWCEKIYVMYKAIDYSSPGRVYVASLLEGGYVTTLMTVLTMWGMYCTVLYCTLPFHCFPSVPLSSLSIDALLAHITLQRCTQRTSKSRRPTSTQVPPTNFCFFQHSAAFSLAFRAVTYIDQI